MHKKESLTLILILFIYLLIFFFMPARGFWIVDNGNKYIQMHALKQNHFSSAAISWQGHKYDPHYDLNPLPNPFSVIKDKKMYSIFPPFFSAISGLLYSIFGLKGIYLIPLLSSLAILLGMFKIGQLLKFSSKQKISVMLLGAFATPILFYSFSFWEHTLAVGLIVWSIFQALLFNRNQRYKHLVASLLLATLAVYFRDELLIYILVLSLSILHINKMDRLKTGCIMAATFIIAFLPLIVCQYFLSGMPLGAHLSKHINVAKSIAVHLKDRPQVVYNLFLALFSPKFISSLFIFLYLFIFTGYFFLSKKWQKILAQATTIIIIIHSLMLLMLLFDSRVLSKLMDSNSLFAASPFLLLLLLKKRQQEKPSTNLTEILFIGRVAIGFILIYLAAAPKVGSTGIHWGCRFLLLLYPILTILLVHRYREAINGIMAIKNVGLAVTLTLSIILQIASLYLLYEKKSYNRNLNQVVSQQPEKIAITNIWHVPQDLSLNFDSKILFYFKGRSQMSKINQILKRLKQRGIKSVLLISPAAASAEAGTLARLRFRDSVIFSLQIKSIKL